MCLPSYHCKSWFSSVVASMFWSTGLILVLAISQVPAEFIKPEFVENVRDKGSNNRILSGWEAYPGQIPYQTSLRLVNPTGGVSGCGGSVVARDWVITAAHCTAGQITVVVRAGLVSLTTPEYIFETSEWYNHPTYNDNMPGVVQANDIAALKLQRPVTYTHILQPIRLQASAEAFRNYDQEVVIASGFGRTWTNGATSEVLNWVYLRAVTNLSCQQLFGPTIINANAICAKFYNVTSQSTCQGDSGGPLVHIGNDGVPILVGVASFVAGGEFGCHSGLPAGFVRPGPFLSWLEQVTGIDFENLYEEEPSTPQPTTETEPPQTTESLAETTQPPYVPTTSQPPYVPTTSQPPYVPTTSQPEYVPTTSRPVAPPTTPAPEEESEEDSSSEEDDPELSELLKKLIIKVKVKVNVNNTLKKKVKVKCVDKAK